MRCYIAGPMTGYAAYNFPAFDDAARKWRAKGYDVDSSADIDRRIWRMHFNKDFDPTVDKADYGDPIFAKMLQADIDAVFRCDAIVLLDGWEKSRGANFELNLAQLLHKQVLLNATDNPPTDESPAQEAYRIVRGSRGADYGHPFDDYTRTGQLWGAILGTPPIAPRIAALMMAALKISREVNKHKRDNLVDLCGYAECVQLIAERES